MKLSAVFFIIMFSIAGIYPSVLYAVDKEIEVKGLHSFALTSDVSFIIFDSLKVKGTRDKKEMDKSTSDYGQSEDKSNRNKPEELRRLGEINNNENRGPQKSSIKQVPRSIPKLKPKSINDRIQIRRPPMRVPKKGFRGIPH